jgi:GDP-4-dehydro-6-deoxy-D-mannose reductase
MKKCLITGVGGFVGRHLLRYFDGVDAGLTEVLGVDLYPEPVIFTPQRFSYYFKQVDLSQLDEFILLAKEFEPDWFIHLAAESSVAASRQDPERCIMNNGNIISNILRFLRLRPMRNRSGCRMLAVGSSEVYGYGEDSMPLEETQPRFPHNPYAISRLYQEDRIRLDVQWQGLNIISTRSFNHTGTGQSDRFVVPSFVRQLCAAKKNGQKSAHLKTGNIQLIRDFSDVRDVVRAYHLLLEHGQSGETYNVCRGEGVSLFKIIEMLKAILELDVTIEIDQELVRSGEPPVVIGSTKKIFFTTGWTPKIPLEQTLRDMVQEQMQ